MNPRIVLPITTAALLLTAAPIGLAQPAAPPAAPPEQLGSLGVPGVHELTGAELGAMVAALARSMPGAAAEHFRAMTPSAELPTSTGLPVAPGERAPAGAGAVGGLGAVGGIGINVGRI
jgi:hypothetical protein